MLNMFMLKKAIVIWSFRYCQKYQLLMSLSTKGPARASDKKLWLKLPLNEVNNVIISLRGEDDLPLESFVNRPIRDFPNMCFGNGFRAFSCFLSF